MAKINKKLQTGIYIRVSTEEQAKDGFSINAQKSKLSKYAEVCDWKIYDYYIDDGISAKNLHDRPEVTRMVEDIKFGNIKNVLVYKLDRLTRSVKDLISLIELFENNDCSFNSVTEKIDTSNAVGRMFVKIIGIFAEFERENLAERVAFGYEQKTKEGNYTNTNGVYGYNYIVGEGRLEVNEEEKKLVNRIFDDYIDGESYFKIANKLNNLKVPTKRGGHWAPATIKSIIHNPLYLGKVRYGINKKDKSFEAQGKNIESIVDEGKWKLAQSVVKNKKHYHTRRYPSENSYYFHTIKCDKCGGNISARQQKQNGKIYITYKCNNSSRKLCDASGFSHQKMEKSFTKYLSNIKNFMPSKEIIEKPKENKQSNITYLDKKINNLENKKKIIRIKFIDEIISIEEYRDIIREIDAKINVLNLNKKTLIESLENKKKNFSYDEITKLVTNIRMNWEYLTNKERKHFLERFVKEIKVVKKENDVLIKLVEFKK